MKILLIEDDAHSSLLIEKYLNQSEFQVRVARDSKEAMDIAMEFEPHYLISDWNIFDHVTGIDVSKAILSLLPQAEVILISAYPKSEIEAKAHAAGVKPIAVLEKPIILSDLLEVLNRSVSFSTK